MVTVQANLEAWLADKEVSQYQQSLLVRLRDALVLRANLDPASAIELLQRIPLYAERLLSPPGTTGGTAAPGSGQPNGGQASGGQQGQGAAPQGTTPSGGQPR
jgi:hypothetical protein